MIFTFTFTFTHLCPPELMRSSIIGLLSFDELWRDSLQNTFILVISSLQKQPSLVVLSRQGRHYRKETNRDGCIRRLKIYPRCKGYGQSF